MVLCSNFKIRELCMMGDGGVVECESADRCSSYPIIGQHNLFIPLLSIFYPSHPRSPSLPNTTSL